MHCFLAMINEKLMFVDYIFSNGRGFMIDEDQDDEDADGIIETPVIRLRHYSWAPRQRDIIILKREPANDTVAPPPAHDD